MPSLPVSAAEHRGLFALMIVAAFIVAGGIHYQTPMLAAIAAEFDADAATVGWIPTLSFGGMMVGMGLVWLLVLAVLVLAAAALVKYLFFSGRK